MLLILNSNSVISKTYEISGIVSDNDQQGGIEKVLIELTHLSDSLFSLNALTNDVGYFKFNKLPIGKYRLHFKRLGYVEEIKTIEIIDKDIKQINIKLNSTGMQSAAIIVSKDKIESKLTEINEHDHRLEGKKLQLELSQTLASTLKNETGISVRSMGPAPARPVIRGLGGNRIQINEDSSPLIDMSASSPDHAVSSDVFSAEQIEVIRGPKVLLNSPTTIGGVINIVHNDIPNKFISKTNAYVGYGYESANKGNSLASGLEVPVDSNIFVKGGISYKKANDVQSPDSILKNTSLSNLHYNLGTSYILPNSVTGISFSGMTSDYGIPGGFIGSHPRGVNISQEKNSLVAKSILHPHGEVIDDINIILSRNYYFHTEYENLSNGQKSIGAQFNILNYAGNIDFIEHENSIFKNGTIGASFSSRDLRYGGFVFTPATISKNIALYTTQETSFDNLELQFGARANYDNINPATIKTSKIGNIREREFAQVSIAVSGLLKLSESFFIGTNLSRTSRPPTAEELFSEGPHLAAYSYELGNPELKSETGLGYEIFSNFSSDNLDLASSVFYYDMDYFITPRNSGKINVATILPEFITSGVKAVITGVEVKANIKFNSILALFSSLSYNYGQNKTDNMPLPMMPPFKAILDLKYRTDDFVLGMKSEIASAQTRLDQFEQETKGYYIQGIYTQYQTNLLSSVSTFSLSIENIFNTIYRNHLSRIKSIFPEPGRSIRFNFKAFL